MDPAFLDDYICGRCSAAGVKLWRPYQTYVDRILCLACTCAKEGRSVSACARCSGSGVTELDAECSPGLGRCSRCGGSGLDNDQIGHYVPAVPCEDGFWGYMAVPQADVDWWQSLPVVDEAREARKRKILINAMAHADILSPEQLVEFDGFEAERLKIEDEREARMTFAVAGEIGDKKP